MIQQSKRALTSAATPRVARRGFTMIEMVIVIGVLLVLAGITVSVVSGMVTRSEIQRTETTLELLNMAMREWEITTDRKLTWSQPYEQTQADIHGTTPEVLIITEMLSIFARPPKVRDVLARVDESSLYTYRAGTYPSWLNSTAERQDMDARFDGQQTVLDAWDKPIYAIHPGRVYAADIDDRFNPSIDDDLTIRTYNEEFYGVAPNREVVFVSAGPDGKFGLPMGEFPGNLPLHELLDAIDLARKDNVFSAPVKFSQWY